MTTVPIPSPDTASDQSQSDQRWFPTLTYKRNGPAQIPWEMAERAYAVYSAEHGKSQSLERMAERGGFGTSELDRYIPGWREELENL